MKLIYLKNQIRIFQLNISYYMKLSSYNILTIIKYNNIDKIK